MNQKCTFCSSGYYNDFNGVCQKCDKDNCAICSWDNTLQASKCDLCKENYMPNEQGGCSPPTCSNSTNCAQCDGLQCARCNLRYGLNNGTCEPCGEGCDYCVSKGTFNKWIQDYNLYGSSDFDLSSSSSDSSSDNSDNSDDENDQGFKMECISCMAGYFLQTEKPTDEEMRELIRMMQEVPDNGGNKRQNAFVSECISCGVFLFLSLSHLFIF